MNKITLIVAVAALLMAGCGSRRPRPQSFPPTATEAPTRSVMPAADAGDRWTFADGPLGTLPSGIRTIEGHWALATEAGTQGLLQDAKNANPIFNLALIDGKNYADVEISVTVHAVAGEIDQGGGPVWRAQDGQNYYIARWNPLEDNYRVYKVVDGVRIQLGSAQTKPGANSRLLYINMTGSTIECTLDGEGLLLVEDTTFSTAGKIGLWAKADARTLFTGLHARALEP